MRSLILVRKHGRSLLVLATLALLSPLFFIGGPNHSHLPSVHYAWNLGHVAFFFCLTLAIFGLAQLTQVSRQARYLCIVLLSSLVIELVQTQFDRFFSLSDIARNLLGAAFALSLLSRTKKRWLWVASLALLILADLTRLGALIWQELQIARRVPIIENFEQPTLAKHWRNNVTLVNDLTYEGRYAAKVELQPGIYANIFFAPLPRNWQGFRTFELAIYWPENEPRTVNIRLHDIEHELNSEKPSNDRFNHSYVLASGWNLLTINLQSVTNAPDTRSLDLANMHSLGIFFTRQQQPGWIVLDALQLKP